jgi:hypothetical protein
MARAARLIGVLPVLGALITATALTGAAVFTVSHGVCTDGGQYIERGGQIVLVGGCLTPQELPGGSKQGPEKDRMHGAYGEVRSSP